MIDRIADTAAAITPALGWTLAHFLWQGALIALVLGLFLKTCRTARARHDLALAALALMALAPVATFAWLRGDVHVVLVPAGFPELVRARDLPWETAAVAAWLAGVAVLAIRTAGGLVLIERLRRTASPLPPEWTARCRALEARMAGSLGVMFAQSEAIAAPLVAGWLKPMVLIPTAVLARLPADQLEALILHELAHVRRLDAFANLLQTLVETALFYHPAVWWVSRRVRIEREHCCDDLAVASVRDPALYVRALQAIEAMRPAPIWGRGGGVLAANGGDLKSRAARILGLAAAPARPALSRTAAMLVLSAAAVAMTHSAAVEAKPAEAPAATPASAPAVSAAPAPVATATSKPEPRVVEAPRIVLAEVAAPPAPLPLRVASAGPTPDAAPVAAPARSLVLALAGAAAGPRAVSPLVVTSGKPAPADVKILMSGDADDPGASVSLWPAEALAQNFDGWVTLRCRFDIHGLAQRCDVAAERPMNKGFAQAALVMRPTFKIDPDQGPNGPVEATKTVAIRFRAPVTYADVADGSRPAFAQFGDIADGRRTGGVGLGGGLAAHRVTMLDYPVWARAPSFDDLAAAYPAKGGGAEGYAVAHCHVLRTGDLEGCEPIKETPEHRDFGRAAARLAEAKFKVPPQLAAAGRSRQLWVDIPIRMPAPKDIDRTVDAPAWLTGVDARATPKIFPPEAAASGLTTGRGIARCTVGADGTLGACAPESAEPAGLGFAEAAARLATGMKINLWSADATPVEGGVVHVPVRLNLKGG